MNKQQTPNNTIPTDTLADLPRVALIAAVAKNRVIGAAGAIPWHLPADLKFFKQKTEHSALIMGRKTWESLPVKPLPNRVCIVLTRDETYTAPVAVGAHVAHTLDAALHRARSLCPRAAEVFIGGGGPVYAAALPYARTLYLTEVDASPNGDAFFPEISPDEWHEVFRYPHTKDKLPFSWVTYKRINN